MLLLDPVVAEATNPEDSVVDRLVALEQEEMVNLLEVLRLLVELVDLVSPAQNILVETVILEDNKKL